MGELGVPWGLPRGVRDLLPAAAAARHELSAVLRRLFANAGFSYVATPMFEYANVLTRGLGSDADLALRFVEPGSGDFLAVRPDFTPQLARLVAQRYRDYRGDLRLCYDGAVYRVQAAQGPREIAQAGIELFGTRQRAADADALRLACAVMLTKGVAKSRLAEATLELGHVAPAQWLLQQASPATRDALIAALRNKDARATVAACTGLPPQAARLAQALLDLTTASNKGVPRAMDAALALPWPRHVRTALVGLASTIADILPNGKGLTLLLDFAEVRGFDYYTGLRFAGYARGSGDAILRGGRYDDLVARYGRHLPAVGFAVDIEALLGSLDASMGSQHRAGSRG